MNKPKKASPRTKKDAPRRKTVAKAKRPVIKALTRAECVKILKRNNVGRLAFSHHDRVDILPIHYVYDGGWLYGRTSPGAKLVKLRHNQWISFEIDEVDGIFDWRSVIVHGTFYTLSPNGPSYEEDIREQALKLTRRLVPDTFKSDDPVPFRTVLFRIYIDEISGRVATQS